MNAFQASNRQTFQCAWRDPNWFLLFNKLEVTTFNPE
jgi:hypothetical protein